MLKLDKIDLIAGICFVLLVSLLAAGVYWKDISQGKQEVVFSGEMSIKEIAQKNGVPVKEIIHQLSHDDRRAWDWHVRAPINALPVEPEKVREAIEHAVKESAPERDLFRFFLWAVYLSACLGILVVWKKIARVRLVLLFGTVVVFGLVLGPTPNPMEGLVKAFKAVNGMEANLFGKIILLLLFSLMVLAGNKLICGWGCQLGALQDIIHRLSPFKRIKRRQVPFWLANGIRVTLFLAFICLLFGFGFGIKNFVIYHHINFFKLFNWTLAPLAFTLLPVLLVLSFLVYRPFCQFICPFGLYAWILENLSLYRVHVSEASCIQCDKCVKACPTEAMNGRMNYQRRSFLPDCWACGACIEACPTDAVTFGRKPPEAAGQSRATNMEDREHGSLAGRG